jgi:hypothetical protein
MRARRPGFIPLFFCGVVWGVVFGPAVVAFVSTTAGRRPALLYERAFSGSLDGDTVRIGNLRHLAIFSPS